MSNYFPDQTLIEALVTDLAGLTNGVSAGWSNAVGTFDAFAGLSALGVPVVAPTTTYTGPVSISLSIPSFSSPFVDDTTYVVNEDDELEVTETGLRYYTLSIRIEADQVNAQEIAERIRAGFRKQSTKARLLEFRSALRDVLETRVMEVKWDNRYVRVAIIDVLLTFAFEGTPDGGEGNGNWIESVTYKDPINEEP